MKIAIGVFFLLFGVGAAYSFYRLSGILTRVSDMLKDVNQEVVPILTRVEATLDGVNSELGKVDDITGSVAGIAKVAEQTTVAVHGAVSKPAKKLAGMAAGLKKSFDTFLSSRDKGE